jgi:hypothetical protein
MTTAAVARPTTAEAVCRLFKPTPAARAMIVPGLPACVLFHQLVGLGLYADARRLLAHALPPRRAVWWAALCLHDSGTRKPFDTPEEEAAFAAAVCWVLTPGEAARRAAGAAGWAARPHTAAGQLALAAFLTGGSMSRPGLPAVYPEPHLCGRLCGVVVYLASVRFDPARYKNYLRQYLEVGLEVARGLNLPPGGAAEEPPPEEPAAPAWTSLDQLTAHVMGCLHNSAAFREDDTASDLLMSAARPPAGTGG